MYYQECKDEDQHASLPERFDMYLNKRFIFKVSVKLFDRGYAPSFTVSSMSYDEALIKRWDKDYQPDNFSNSIQAEEDVSVNKKIIPIFYF